MGVEKLSDVERRTLVGKIKPGFRKMETAYNEYIRLTIIRDNLIPRSPTAKTSIDLKCFTANDIVDVKKEDKLSLHDLLGIGRNLSRCLSEQNKKISEKIADDILKQLDALIAEYEDYLISCIPNTK